MFFEGAVYDVYNRLARGKGVFNENAAAEIIRKLLLEWDCSALGIDPEDLKSRLRQPETVRALEILAAIGMERWSFRVVDLARAMKKSPYTVTKVIHRVTQRRRTDTALRQTFEDLDRTHRRWTESGATTESIRSMTDGMSIHFLHLASLEADPAGRQLLNGAPGTCSF